ncbi:MAG: nuclear transport factor 2 family protein [Chitinophagaceae bacterium]
MKKMFTVVVASTMVLHTLAQSTADKNAVNAGVSAFINGWNSHNFEDIGNYATKGFYYISPDAEIFESLDTVQKKLQSMHNGGFKNTTLEEKNREIRFLTKVVAMATVTAHLGIYYSGKKEKGDYWQIRTMTFVKQNGKWLLAAAQATAIPPAIKPITN